MTEETQYAVAVARKSLSEGIVEIRISKSAELASLPTPEGVIKYLRFKQGVKGGNVPVYLHTDDQSVVGKLIRARFTLFERTCANETKDVHIDLRPSGEEATHRIFFLTEPELRLCADEWRRFRTPQVSRGFIVIAPVDAKLKEPTTPANSPGSDPQLSRLIGSGWSIKEDRGASCVLSKSDPKGGERTMIHHRPKRK